MTPSPLGHHIASSSHTLSSHSATHVWIHIRKSLSNLPPHVFPDSVSVPAFTILTCLKDVSAQWQDVQPEILHIHLLWQPRVPGYVGINVALLTVVWASTWRTGAFRAKNDLPYYWAGLGSLTSDLKWLVWGHTGERTVFHILAPYLWSHRCTPTWILVVTLFWAPSTPFLSPLLLPVTPPSSTSSSVWFPFYSCPLLTIPNLELLSSRRYLFPLNT